MEFPFYFLKVIWVGGGTYFVTKFFSENAKHTGICPNFGGNMSRIYLRHCPSIPPPKYIEIFISWSWSWYWELEICNFYKKYATFLDKQFTIKHTFVSKLLSCLLSFRPESEGCKILLEDPLLLVQVSWSLLLYCKWLRVFWHWPGRCKLVQRYKTVVFFHFIDLA